MIANEAVFGTLLRKGWDPIIIADRLALGLARARARLSLPLARVAARFIERRLWENFGYARLEDHARERFGRSGRWMRDLRSLHEAMTRCPALARAIVGDDGGVPLGTVAALVVGRVATDDDTCGEWIALARKVTVRELRQRVREAAATAQEEGAAAGEVPSSAESPSVGTMGRTESGIAEVPSDEVAAADDDEDVVTIRFSTPRAVGAVIDEARELHRAVCGGETTANEFVEAILAECLAGPVTPLPRDPWASVRPGSSERELAMERKGEGWTFLKDVRLDGEELCEARRTLEKVEDLCREAESPSFDGDSAIRKLILLENEIELRLGDLLAMMGESGAWRGLRFGGVGHYAEERLGLSRSVAQGRSHLSRVLREHGALREACVEGRIGFEAAAVVVRAMSRLAGTPSGSDPGTAALEAVWIEHAEESTLKRLREELLLLDRERALGSLGAGAMAPVDDETWQRARSRRPGQAIERLDRLTSALDGSPRADTVIRFRLPRDLASHLLSAVRQERWRLEDICREARKHHPDLAWDRMDAAAVTGARGVVGGGSDSGAAAASGYGASAVGEGPGDGSAIALGDSAGTANVGAGAPPAEPGSGISRALRAALMFSTRYCGVPEWIALLSLIEGFITTWDDPRMSPNRAADRIYIRDGWRCTAPGCSSRRNLEEHHIVYRSRNGSHSPSNRVTLCRYHHLQGEHGGLMRCRGEAPLGITWWMGMHAAGGVFQNERRIDERAERFARLHLSAS